MNEQHASGFDYTERCAQQRIHYKKLAEDKKRVGCVLISSCSPCPWAICDASGTPSIRTHRRRIQILNFVRAVLRVSIHKTNKSFT